MVKDIDPDEVTAQHVLRKHCWESYRVVRNLVVDELGIPITVTKDADTELTACEIGKVRDYFSLEFAPTKL